ncbi:MAG TPA: hypothetical protein VIX12_04570 [Candidatus Binataceae bacterium]
MFKYPRATFAIAAIIGVTLTLGTAGCKAPKTVASSAPVMDSAKKNPDEPTKALPADLFQGMPIYPGAQVDHVRKPKGSMREIVFDTDANLSALVAFYKQALKKNDFHVTSALIMPARKTWSCDFHKDGRPASIMLFPDEDDPARMTIDLIYELPARVDASLLEPKEDFDVVGPGEVAQASATTNPGENASDNASVLKKKPNRKAKRK